MSKSPNRPMSKRQLSKHYGIALFDIEKAITEGAPVLLPGGAFVSWMLAQRGGDHVEEAA